jgi:hypothetical protein
MCRRSWASAHRVQEIERGDHGRENTREDRRDPEEWMKRELILA